MVFYLISDTNEFLDSLLPYVRYGLTMYIHFHLLKKYVDFVKFLYVYNLDNLNDETIIDVVDLKQRKCII